MEQLAWTLRHHIGRGGWEAATILAC
jgi:hypothetical protein